MIITYIMFSLLIILTLAVFYLIIRLKDIRSDTDSLCAKFPINEDMRKQASDTISNINKEKTQEKKDGERRRRGTKNLFKRPKGRGGRGGKDIGEDPL